MAAKRKREHYEPLLEDNVTFVPASVECHGTMCKELRLFLKTIARHYTNEVIKDLDVPDDFWLKMNGVFVNQMYQSLSVALISGVVGTIHKAAQKIASFAPRQPQEQAEFIVRNNIAIVLFNVLIK